ncbi:hypothetical protein Btru_066394 [Bulinus truncatus]|nr:hypothetical protein Btru_066394 [Bulinus truncatus]
MECIIDNFDNVETLDQIFPSAFVRRLNLCVTPLSYISSDDRAISSRPRVPHCDDSGENTSNDEAEF